MFSLDKILKISVNLFSVVQAADLQGCLKVLKKPEFGVTGPEARYLLWAGPTYALYFLSVEAWVKVCINFNFMRFKPQFQRAGVSQLLQFWVNSCGVPLALMLVAWPHLTHQKEEARQTWGLWFICAVFLKPREVHLEVSSSLEVLPFAAANHTDRLRSPAFPRGNFVCLT